MIPPTSIDGTDITGATIDGTDVQEITVDGDTVFTAGPTLPVAYSNLVAWYPFDSAEYGGSNADDVTAILGGSGDDTAHDGTVNGATYQSSGGVKDIRAGANSGAFDFDGSNDNIDISSLLPLTFTSGNTVMLWVKLDANQEQSMFDSEGRYALSYGFQTNHYEFDIYNGSSWVAADTGVAQSSGYVHLAGTAVQGGDMKVYLDGQLKDTQSISNFDRLPRNTSIGSNDRGTRRHTDGTIDDVRFYDAVLTQSQIQDIFDNTKP